MADKIDKLTAMQIEKGDGTRTDDIPVGAKAENVEMENGRSVQETIGEIDVYSEGDVATQLKDIKNVSVPTFSVSSGTLNIDTKSHTIGD